MYEIDISGFNLFFNNLIKRMSWLEIITVDCDFITRSILTLPRIIAFIIICRSWDLMIFIRVYVASCGERINLNLMYLPRILFEIVVCAFSFLSFFFFWITKRMDINKTRISVPLYTNRRNRESNNVTRIPFNINSSRNEEESQVSKSGVFHARFYAIS